MAAASPLPLTEWAQPSCACDVTWSRWVSEQEVELRHQVTFPPLLASIANGKQSDDENEHLSKRQRLEEPKVTEASVSL